MCLTALLSIWFNLVQMASMAIATKLKPDGALPQPKAAESLKHMLFPAQLLSICTVAMKSKIATPGELENILFHVIPAWS